MKKRHMAIAGVIVAVWVGIIGFFIIKSKEKESNQNIERHIIPEQKKVFINGMVEPTQSKVFYKNMTKGENYIVNKNNEDSVSKGSLLITYKNDEISEQIKDLNGQLHDLRKEEKEGRNIKENQLIENQNQMTEPIEEQIKSTSKELSKLKNKEYSYEYAPFAGKVYTDNKNINGENQELLKLRSTEFYIKSQVTENELEKIKEDHKVEILILANDKKVKGKITEISDEPKSQDVGLNGEISGSASASVSSYPISITLDSQEGIVNGYHVQIKIELSNKDSKIPTSAIKVNGNRNYVYLIKDNKLVKQFVEVKKTEGDLSIITSGLKEKDEIVKVITNEMKEGQEIE